jgi:diguanylate cyclase (GGDEF)-like protein
MKESESFECGDAAGAAGNTAESACVGTSGPGPQAERASILLVNDDPRTLFALRAVLSDLDAQVLTASSGEQALMRLLKQNISLIILDVKMARMDGFETARLIRSRPRSQTTPIIFLTSHRATDVDRETGFAIGAADYLFMPVAPETLKSKVQMLLAASGQCGERPAGAAASVAASNPCPAYPPIPQAGDYVALLDSAATWLYASASFQTRFALPMQPGGSYLAIVHEDDQLRVGAILSELTQGHGPRRLQYKVLGQDERYFETDINVIQGAGGAVEQLVLVSRDITERKEMEAYVLHQSFHDALTGLPNRQLLIDRLGQATAHRDRQQATVAVLFIDLDHFKDVNDTLGHAAGDRLLQDVAERLASCVRDGDTVARLGGDEFVVILLGLRDSEDAALVADKMVARLCAPCQIDGAELHVTPSIGIAIFPDDGVDSDRLLRNADTAMYHAKREGGSRFCFFTAEMQEAARHKLAMGAALQRAIRAEEFEMHYQPKVSARSGEICGFEALIRWPQAAGDWISPAVFIPIAEESGRIESIGRWVLSATTQELQRWEALGFGDVPIAVNLSALQFRSVDLAGDLASVVHATGIAPSMLEIELTETGVMSNPALAVELLNQMHAMGFHISIDDFGTGYSSLAYLKRFPIDKLKIDASFVRDIATDASDAAIVLAIITLGHVLDLTVIAEGVETAEQAAFLMEHGCDEMQGNYFSAAVPNDEALALLRERPFRSTRQP